LVVIRRAHCALLCLFSFIGHPANIKWSYNLLSGVW
jgi:hypothetical protein